jgi:hypothetical protein
MIGRIGGVPAAARIVHPPPVRIVIPPPDARPGLVVQPVAATQVDIARQIARAIDIGAAEIAARDFRTLEVAALDGDGSAAPAPLRRRQGRHAQHCGDADQADGFHLRSPSKVEGEGGRASQTL